MRWILLLEHTCFYMFPFVLLSMCLLPYLTVSPCICNQTSRQNVSQTISFGLQNWSVWPCDFHFIKYKYEAQGPTLCNWKLIIQIQGTQKQVQRSLQVLRYTFKFRNAFLYLTSLDTHQHGSMCVHKTCVLSGFNQQTHTVEIFTCQHHPKRTFCNGRNVLSNTAATYGYWVLDKWPVEPKGSHSWIYVSRATCG